MTQDTPPSECRKDPAASTPIDNGGQQIQQGAGSIPVVGGGLQQGASSATQGGSSKPPAPIPPING